MKVSDVMVEALRAVLIERMAKPPGRVASRAALEAALADVPEQGGLSGPEALRLRIASERYKTRAEAAEAKLAKVRAWRAEYSAPTETRNGLSHEAEVALDAILDEEL